MTAARLIFTPLLLFALSLSAQICDLQAAREYCDNASLAPIEGVWIFPEDKVTVLVHDARSDFGRYDITVVDSENGKLSPGTNIGILELTPEPDTYKLTFYGRGKSPFKHSQSFVAKLRNEGETISLQRRKTSVRFNFLSLLPRLGRLLSITTSDPANELSSGLYRLYPSYDGNGSSRLKPRRL